MSCLKKLSELSVDPVLKEALRAFESRDYNQCRQLQKNYSGDDTVGHQIGCITELFPLQTLSNVKSEVQRKALVDSATASMSFYLNRVSLVAQKLKNSELKQWCEQYRMLFAELSGGKYSPAASLSPSHSPVVPKEPVPTRGTIKNEGNKWCVQGFQLQAEPIILEGIPKQSSVCICDCLDTVIQINPAEGKLVAVAVDSSKGVGVVVQGDVIASVDFVNVRKCQFQVFGHVPSVSVDSSDSLSLFLSKKCADVSVVTCRSTEVNIIHPIGWDSKSVRKVIKKTKRMVKKVCEMHLDSAEAAADEAVEEDNENVEGDSDASEPTEEKQEESEYEEIEEEVEVDEEYDAEQETTEVAVPVQFRSFFVDGRLVTEPLQHAGSN